MPKDKKQKLKQYQKNYREAKENQKLINLLFYRDPFSNSYLISSRISSDTFNFFNLISTIFNSFLMSSAYTSNFDSQSLHIISHFYIVINSVILSIFCFDFSLILCNSIY